MPATPTFVFDDDGKVYAYLAGKIVAAADDADELERKLAEFGKEEEDEPVVPPSKEEKAPEETEEDPEEDSHEARVANATHVTTPNGLKGTILGKQKGLWGDQITIRLENGRIAKFDVTADSKVEYVNENKGEAPWPTKHTVIASLEEKLAEMPDGTKHSLLDRVEELKNIKRNARSAIASVDYTDSQSLDNIIVQADYELREVTDALSALEDAEPYAPPAPFNTGVVEQEAMGGGDSSWLDQAVGEIIAENEAQDFDQMMDEGPELFVSELETPVLEDGQHVEQMASEYVQSRTIGIDPDVATTFRTTFLQRVAQARVTELESRVDTQRIAKEAAADEDYDGPAEGLFF